MVDIENKSEQTVQEDSYNELLDSKYPLLQSFKETCPGTYRHSQTMVSIVEGVAEAVDLNINEMKVVCLYHDVGKLLNPKVFTENQLDGINIHDSLSPEMSYEIITRHVSDSVLILLDDPNFSKRIIRIISQHHGNSILKPFFDKASKAKEDDFRYKTSNPDSLEAGVLMILDQIEARSRSLDKFEPDELIDGTINKLIDDGLLDNVVIRLGGLKKIKETLYIELQSMFKKRVSYEEKYDD